MRTRSISMWDQVLADSTLEVPSGLGSAPKAQMMKELASEDETEDCERYSFSISWEYLPRSKRSSSEGIKKAESLSGGLVISQSEAIRDLLRLY